MTFDETRNKRLPEYKNLTDYSTTTTLCYKKWSKSLQNQIKALNPQNEDDAKIISAIEKYYETQRADYILEASQVFNGGYESDSRNETSNLNTHFLSKYTSDTLKKVCQLDASEKKSWEVCDSAGESAYSNEGEKEETVELAPAITAKLMDGILSSIKSRICPAVKAYMDGKTIEEFDPAEKEKKNNEDYNSECSKRLTEIENLLDKAIAKAEAGAPDVAKEIKNSATAQTEAESLEETIKEELATAVTEATKSATTPAEDLVEKEKEEQLQSQVKEFEKQSARTVEDAMKQLQTLYANAAERIIKVINNLEVGADKTSTAINAILTSTYKGTEKILKAKL